MIVPGSRARSRNSDVIYSTPFKVSIYYLRNMTVYKYLTWQIDRLLFGGNFSLIMDVVDGIFSGCVNRSVDVRIELNMYAGESKFFD